MGADKVAPLHNVSVIITGHTKIRATAYASMIGYYADPILGACAMMYSS